MDRAPITARVVVLFTSLLAACSEPGQVRVSFGAVKGPLAASGVSVLLKVSQDGNVVSSDEKALDLTSGVASAELAFSDVVADKPAIFAVSVIWAPHANRVLLQASKTLSAVSDGSKVEIADGDIVNPGGKPDSDNDTYSDLAEVLAGTDPDNGSSKPSSGGSTVSVTVTGGGTVRFDQTLTLNVAIDKGDGTSTTDTAQATWEVADSSIATVSAGVVTAKEEVGQTTVTATYGGVTSSPVTIRVEPGKVHLRCEQGLGVATNSVSNCTLWSATSAGVDIKQIPLASWHLTSSDTTLAFASDWDTIKSIVGQLNADGPVTITGSYNDGTPGGLADAQSWDVVNLKSLSITPDVSDVMALTPHDFAFSYTRPSGRPLPNGFLPPWSLAYGDTTVLYGYVRTPQVVSIRGSWMGTSTVWVKYGDEVSNAITLRSVPDHVGFVTPGTDTSVNGPVTVPVGTDVTLEIRPWVSSFQYTYLAASATFSTASNNGSIATATHSLASGTGSTGAVASLVIHGEQAGSTTVTATINGVTSPQLSVNVQ